MRENRAAVVKAHKAFTDEVGWMSITVFPFNTYSHAHIYKHTFEHCHNTHVEMR